MLKTLPWRMMACGCSVGVLAGLLVVAFESDFPGQICEYNQATKHEDCTVYSFFPFLLIQISKTLNEYGVAITGIATVFLAIITGWLVSVARDQSKTTRAQLRAYIAVEAAMRHGGHTLMPQFNIRFKNCGQTPAYNGTYWIDVKVCESPLTSNLIPSGKKSIGRFELPPTNAFSIGQINNDNIVGLSGEQASEFNDGKIAFYIFGQCDFSDAFNEPRWLKFRFRYETECVAYGALAIEEINSN